MTRLIMAFQQAGLLIVTESDELVPSRDIGRITVCEILDAARNQRSGQITPRSIAIPSVDRLIAAIEEARRQRCGNLTLRDLIEETPRPALTLAARRD